MNEMPSHKKLLLSTCLFVSVFFALSGCVTPTKKEIQPIVQPEEQLPATSLHRIPDNTIALPLLENSTFEPLLEQRLTRLLKATLVSSGWKVVADNKDASTVILGGISHFSERPISLTPRGGAREYRLNITLELKFLSNTNAPAINTATVIPIEGSADYFARADTMSHRRAKDRAVREAGKKLSRKVSSLLRLQKSLQLHKTEEKEAVFE